MLFPTAKPRGSISKYLGKKYGGVWKYDGMCSWWCNDDVRHVSRVQSCSCDDACSHFPDYRLYGDGINGIIHFD
jgi:hypothetical protein